jgi:GntR family transcriptional regulator
VPDLLSLTLRSTSGTPYYRQIVDHVTDLVMAGELEPGAQIPSVRELAAALAVSLITTRRAYADLEAAGVVSRHRGQGTFIAARPRAAALRRLQAEATEDLRSALRRALQLGLDVETLHELLDQVASGPPHVDPDEQKR